MGRPKQARSNVKGYAGPRTRCTLQANAQAAGELHKLKCELVYMRDREDTLKHEVQERSQELQVGRLWHVACVPANRLRVCVALPVWCV